MLVPTSQKAWQMSFPINHHPSAKTFETYTLIPLCSFQALQDRIHRRQNCSDVSTVQLLPAARMALCVLTPSPG
jgi:hypothetical protein